MSLLATLISMFANSPKVTYQQVIIYGVDLN